MTDYEHKDDCRPWRAACACRPTHEQTWLWNEDRSQVEVADDRSHVVLETDSGCYGPRGGEIPLIVQAPAMARLLIRHEWHPHDESGDYCVECGGSKPHPDDAFAMGHVKGCALAAILKSIGVAVRVGGCGG